MLTLKNITINPTESEYGESKYLTEEDMKEIKEVFEETVENKNYIVGTNEAIKNQLAANGVLNTSFLMGLNQGYISSRSESFVCDDLGALKEWIKSSMNFSYMPGANSTEIYMTIKDTADGKIECHIYAVYKQ